MAAPAPSSSPQLSIPAATYSGELDYGSGNTLSTPNVAPDIIAKLAFDPNKHVHFEIGGVERNFKVYNPGAAATGSTAAIPANISRRKAGAGFVNLNVEVVKGFRLLTNNFWSDGVGRYIYGKPRTSSRTPTAPSPSFIAAQR